MKPSTKSRIIVIVIILLFLLSTCYLIRIIQESNRLNNYCKSKGYDGVSMEVFGEKEKCWRKIQLEAGYKYEYSGYIE